MPFLRRVVNENCGYCEKKLIIGLRGGEKLFCTPLCRRKLLKWLMKHTRILFEGVRECPICKGNFGIVASVNGDRITCGNPECRMILANKKRVCKVAKNKTYGENTKYPKDRKNTCHHRNSDKISCKHYLLCLDTHPKCSDGASYEPSESVM
jgi:hypothetical protein